MEKMSAATENILVNSALLGHKEEWAGLTGSHESEAHLVKMDHCAISIKG